MFSYQIQGKWAKADDLLRVALGIPLPYEVHNRKQSSIPATAVECFKLMLKFFGVDEKGMFKAKGDFNANGFRKSFYREFQRKLCCSRQTVSRIVGAFKEAGLLDTYQDINEDGSLGQWWTRLNPMALLDLLAKLSSKKASKQPSPCLSDEALLSSSKQQAEVAVATQQSDSVKKGIDSPGGDDSNLPEQTPGFSDFAKEEILNSETGKVLPELVKVIPAFATATPKQLMKLHNLVHHFVPSLRCSQDMAETMTETMTMNPDFLENFRKIGIENRGDKLGVVDTFLKFWPGVARKLWATRLSRHDQDCYDDRYAIDELRENLFAPANKVEIDRDRKLDPGSYWVRCLALALTHKWTAAVVAVIAKQARGYLMRRPISYTMVYKQFPQIVRLCQITEAQHKKLMSEALTIKTRLNVWSEVQATYGFEYVLTPVQRRREGGVLAYSETDGRGDEATGHAA